MLSVHLSFLPQILCSSLTCQHGWKPMPILKTSQNPSGEVLWQTSVPVRAIGCEAGARPVQSSLPKWYSGDMDNVDIGTLWKIRGTLGPGTVAVEDVADGVNPVVIYKYLDGGDETGMAGMPYFLSRFEQCKDRI